MYHYVHQKVGKFGIFLWQPTVEWINCLQSLLESEISFLPYFAIFLQENLDSQLAMGCLSCNNNKIFIAQLSALSSKCHFSLISLAWVLLQLNDIIFNFSSPFDSCFPLNSKCNMFIEKIFYHFDITNTFLLTLVFVFKDFIV